jgi:multidrug efflux pump subunit AcrA (membrane-fusion protein)
MTTDLDLAKQAAYDKLTAQLKTAEATLDTLKARAETAKANAELKVIAEVVGKKLVVEKKLFELKHAGEWERTKKEVESHIADFERAVKNIESKVKRS